MNRHSFLIIMVAAAVTLMTRAAPFVLFPAGKEQPKWVEYLGRVLPPAVMAMLVIYGISGASFFEFPFAMPEILAIGAVILIHKLWRNMLISILGGTGVYMILVQLVFK